MAILALTSADNGPKSTGSNTHDNSIKNALKATDLVSISELESLPSMDKMTVKKLEEMSLREGAEWINKMYHLSQAGRAFEAAYAPKASEISSYYITPDGKKVDFKLKELPRIAREEKDFGDEEVTVYITGLPEETETVKKAHNKLVQAYNKRYNGQKPESKLNEDEDNSSEKRRKKSSSEEEEEDNAKKNSNKPRGTLLVIDLGKIMTKIRNYLSLDVEKAGEEIANIIKQVTDKISIPHESVHVIGSNMGAHVAGAVGRKIARETGRPIRRITGLDPSKIYAHADKALKGLARGDADFVDVIHTSAHGLGTPTRGGDADFYPDGPSEGVPGARNVVDASLRAVLYFAETVVPGNERNFPAVKANSLDEYKNKRGQGKRIYMGLKADNDAKGDFMLQVNAKSPYGRKNIVRKEQDSRKIQSLKKHSLGD